VFEKGRRAELLADAEAGLADVTAVRGGSGQAG
jgi:hypothetical protein